MRPQHPVYFNFEASQAKGTLALTTLYPHRKISLPLSTRGAREIFDYTFTPEIQLGDLSILISDHHLVLKFPKGKKLANLFGEKTLPDFFTQFNTKINSAAKHCTPVDETDETFRYISINSLHEHNENYAQIQNSLIQFLIYSYFSTRFSDTKRFKDFVLLQMSNIMDRLRIPQRELDTKLIPWGFNLNPASENRAGCIRRLIINAKEGTVNPSVEMTLLKGFHDFEVAGVGSLRKDMGLRNLPNDIFTTETTVSITRANPLDISNNPSFVVRIERFLAKSYLPTDHKWYFPRRIDLTTKTTRTLAFLREWRYLIAPALILSITALILSFTLPVFNSLLLNALNGVALFGLVAAAPVILTVLSLAIGTGFYLHKQTLFEDKAALLLSKTTSNPTFTPRLSVWEDRLPARPSEVEADTMLAPVPSQGTIVTEWNGRTKKGSSLWTTANLNNGTARTSNGQVIVRNPLGKAHRR